VAGTATMGEAPKGHLRKGEFERAEVAEQLKKLCFLESPFI